LWCFFRSAFCTYRLSTLSPHIPFHLHQTTPHPPPTEPTQAIASARSAARGLTSGIFATCTWLLVALLALQLAALRLATPLYLRHRTTITVVNRLLRNLFSVAYFGFPRDLKVLQEGWEPGQLLGSSIVVPPFAFLQQVGLWGQREGVGRLSSVGREGFVCRVVWLWFWGVVCVWGVCVCWLEG